MLVYRAYCSAKYVALALVVLLSLGRIADAQSREYMDARRSDTSLRLVSLAPSITEIIYALGRGSSLVGVTRYCDYPPETQDVAKVGGFLDPNIESILRLQPNLVLALSLQQSQVESLRALGLRLHLLQQNSIAEVLSSIIAIGNLVKASGPAQKLRDEIQHALDAVEMRVKKLARPRVLVAVGGHATPGSLEAVYVAGGNTFYSELITLAGGKNIYEGRVEHYALLSAEGVLALDPEVIIDLSPSTSSVEQTTTLALEAWQSLPRVTAVKTHRVTVLTEEFVVNPGPRIALTLELFAKAIHPEEFHHATTP